MNTEKQDEPHIYLQKLVGGDHWAAVRAACACAQWALDRHWKRKDKSPQEVLNFAVMWVTGNAPKSYYHEPERALSYFLGEAHRASKASVEARDSGDYAAARAAEAAAMACTACAYKDVARTAVSCAVSSAFRAIDLDMKGLQAIHEEVNDLIAASIARESFPDLIDSITRKSSPE